MAGNFLQRKVAQAAQNPLAVAIFYMLVSTAAFSAMNICVRLASATLPTLLIVTLRNLLSLLLLVPLVMGHGFAIIRTTRLKGHFWRSVIGTIGMVGWTYCLGIMPIVHATALSFTAPLLTTLAAILVLKEHAAPRHFVALAIGFFGALVILRPGMAGFDWRSLLVIATTTAWATVSLFIKSLSRTEPALRMVFYMNLFMFILSLPFGLGHWQTPTAAEWLLLLGISAFSILTHFTMVKAYARADVVTLMPFDFMRLIYTSVFAYFLFGETSDLWTWVGAGMIVAGAVIASARGGKPPLEIAQSAA